MATQGRASAADMIQLIRDSGPVSRTELARLSGLAVSTVSLRVEELLAAGLIEEAGDGLSRGGRRPRLLRIRSGGAVVLAADVGTHHARIGLVDLAGQLVATQDTQITLSDGPGVVLAEVADRLDELVAARGGPDVLGVSMGLPGPVQPGSGRITSPSRMPGWHGATVGDWLTDRYGVPALVENDANLLALGEYRTRSAQHKLGHPPLRHPPLRHPPLRHLVAVKVGRGIGCGIVAGGALFYGANGAAGDISHVSVISAATESARLCGCGHRGCLETIASGAALLDELAAAGQQVDSPAALVELVQRGDPAANLAVRTAGWHLGEVLAVVVNFFNPEMLVLGGVLASADPLVASARAAIYERCLPMASQSVTITTATSGPDTPLIGAAALLLDRLTQSA